LSRAEPRGLLVAVLPLAVALCLSLSVSAPAVHPARAGLIIYCGTILTDEGKEKKVNIDFEPFRPINTSLYLCDNKFHVEALSELM
jgi:peptide subunit release factor 1 (eRF1)